VFRRHDHAEKAMLEGAMPNTAAREHGRTSARQVPDRIRIAAERFRDAATHINLALLELDAAASGCQCCGATVARRRGEWEVYKNTSGLPDKLRDHADRLMAKGEEPVNKNYDDALAAFHAAAERAKGDDNG
jgi:hypothetical protein